MNEKIPAEVERVLRETNPWWEPPHRVRPAPPPYRRAFLDPIRTALARPSGKIQAVRGPRQVGKTTAFLQLVEEAIRNRAVPPRDILYVRYDLDILREAGLRPILRWYASEVRGKSLLEDPPLVFLDEVHKVPRWDEEVKHAFDTYRLRMAITGSSSVLVARGTRESLAGRAHTIEFPPFLFREVVEMAYPQAARHLPPRLEWSRLIETPAALERYVSSLRRHPAQRRLAWKRALSRYFQRGGYPDLYTGAVEEDRWADHLIETVFERVLGVDIPDLFPVDQPRLLRHIYMEVARLTGRIVSQKGLAEAACAAGYATNQPTVGRYLHYLHDALLIREFRRYPLSRKATAKVPSKITLTDLGVRNAIFRGAPDLWEAPPAEVGPLVETVVQTVLRAPHFQVHFYRDLREKGRPRLGYEEVDFVLEAPDGTVVPVEVKFQARIRGEDLAPLQHFSERFRPPVSILVTRDALERSPRPGMVAIPFLDFLLAF